MNGRRTMANRNINGQNYNIRIENNAPIIKAELKRKIGLMLIAIGEKWRTLVDKEITVRRIVDTGALRRSMNYKVDKSAKKVRVGSPLDYATKQEFDNPKGPYLKPSILDYKESYKNVAEHIMEE